MHSGIGGADIESFGNRIEIFIEQVRVDVERHRCHFGAELSALPNELLEMEVFLKTPGGQTGLFADLAIDLLGQA